MATRTCEQCSTEMIEGYLIGGDKSYCSMPCVVAGDNWVESEEQFNANPSFLDHDDEDYEHDDENYFTSWEDDGMEYTVTTEIIGTRTWLVDAYDSDQAIELTKAGKAQFIEDDYTDPQIGDVIEVEKLNDPDVEGGRSDGKSS